MEAITIIEEVCHLFAYGLILNFQKKTPKYIMYNISSQWLYAKEMNNIDQTKISKYSRISPLSIFH